MCGNCKIIFNVSEVALKILFWQNTEINEPCVPPGELVFCVAANTNFSIVCDGMQSECYCGDS